MCIKYCSTLRIFDTLYGTFVQAAEAQLTAVEGERQGLSEHVEELRLKVSTVEAELEEARKDLDQEREDSRRKSREMTDMQQKADKWKTDASNIQVWLHC